MAGFRLTLRRNWWWIVTAALAAVVAAAFYVHFRAPVYDASAQLLVSPVAATDSTFVGLDVLRDDGKRTAAATAARLIDTPQVADAVKNRLGTARSRTELLEMVKGRVLGHSDVVAVDARSSRSSEAAQLANAFADAVVAQRTALFQSNVTAAVRRTQAALAALPARQRTAPQGVVLGRTLAKLRTLVGTPDPTIKTAAQAVAPEHPSWPKRWQTIAVAGVAGLLAGLGAALLRDLLRPVPVAVGGDLSAAPTSRAAERLAQRLEARLTERIETLTRREAALAVRERDVTQKLEELRAAGGDPAGASPHAGDDLRRREVELEQRLQAVTRRERELARRAGELAARERTAGSPPALAAAPDPQPPPQPVAPPPAAAARGGDGIGRFNLSDLERLVAARSDEFPHRAEEWQSYLFLLRDYADAGGALPSSFDWLVDDTFSELLP